MSNNAKIYDSIELRAQKVLDARTIVTYKEQLCQLDTWPHDIGADGKPIIYMKEGMVITVTGTKNNPVFDLYILVDLDKILDKNYAGWKYYGGGSGGAMTANLDGGRASEVYTPSQILDFGSQNGASVRGEIGDIEE